MKTITFKTHYGRHIVMVNDEVNVFNTIREALTFIFRERGIL